MKFIASMIAVVGLSISATGLLAQTDDKGGPPAKASPPAGDAPDRTSNSAGGASKKSKPSGTEAGATIGGAIGSMGSFGAMSKAAASSRRSGWESDEIELLAGTRRIAILSSRDTSGSGLTTTRRPGNSIDYLGGVNLVVRVPVPEAEDAAKYVKLEHTSGTSAARNSASQPVDAAFAKARQQTGAPVGFDLYEAQLAAPLLPGEYTVFLKDKAVRFSVGEPRTKAACEPGPDGTCK